MKFDNLPAVTEYLAFTVQARVAGSRTGFSSQSCSAYVRFAPSDEDGDYLVDDDGAEISREVRFSDHGDRHPVDGRKMFNITDRAEELSDDDGEFDGFEVADWWIAETIDAAAAYLENGE